MELVSRPNFLLSQAITGRGAFNYYLRKIEKRFSPMCRCGNVIQTSAHVFKDCALYANGRPVSWEGGIATEKVSVMMMRRLWLEEKEEEKSGLNKTRVQDGSRRRQRRR